MNEDCIRNVMNYLGAMDAFNFSIANGQGHIKRFKHYVHNRLGHSDEDRTNSLLHIDNTKSDPLLVFLLTREVFVLARSRLSCGTKLEEEYKMYPCFVQEYKSGSYRYHKGVKTIGAYASQNVMLNRIFIKLTTDEKNSYVEWQIQNNKSRDVFDDNGATVFMKQRFSQASSYEFTPVFGFIDRGNVLAASAQSSVINPFIDTCSALHLRQSKLY